MLNHFKILNTQKLTCLVGLFGLKSFHEFVSLVQLEDVTDCLSYVLFCIITLFFMTGNSKSIQKTSICSNKNTEKELNNITYIFRWKHISFLPPPTPFLKKRIKFQKTIDRERNFLRKSVAETKIGQDFFSFVFSLLAIITDTAFKTSSLGKLFQKKMSLAILRIGYDKTDLLVFGLKI